MVLELRRNFFEEHVQSLFRPDQQGKDKKATTTNSKMNPVMQMPDGVELTLSLNLSEALENDLWHKLQIHQRFVAPLEATVERLLIASNRADSSEAEEGDSEGGRWRRARKDPNGEVPNERVGTTFYGRQEAAHIASAKTKGRYVATQPDVAPLPPLDYELLALSMQCSVGWEGVYQVLDRARTELSKGAVGATDVERLMALGEVLELVDPDFTSALRYAAKSL